MVSLKLRSRQWLVDENDNIIIGDGRREILENTAKVMKMSYKGVWSKIKATESSMNLKLVDTNKKRGSQLTKEGKELLEKYNMLKRKCKKADDDIFKSIFKQKRK
jgi:molybdate transport system regulatory protein